MSLFLILWFLSLTGLGSFVLSRTTGHETNGLHAPSAALTGLICVSGLSLGVNFFMPVTPAVSAVFCAAGLAAFFTRLQANLREINLLHFITLTAAAVFLHWTGSATAAFPLDTAVYHLQAVQWIEKSKLVFGLANLEGKLGFNSTWFPLAAGLGLPGMAGKGPFIINSLLFLIYCRYLQAVFLNRKDTAEHGISGLFLLAAFFPVISEFVFRRHAVDPSTDAPVMLISFLGIFLLLRAAEKNRLKEEGGLLLLTACFVVSVKLSAAMIALPLGATGLFCLAANPKPKGFWTLPLLTVVIMGLWCLRGAALSGCLLFPSSIGCFNHLDWSVPQAVLQGETDVIRFWARKPFFAAGEIPVNDWAWLKPWFKTLSAETTLKLIGASAAAGLLFFLIPAKPGQKAPCRPAILTATFAALAAGILFWFLTAPDPRFGLAYTGSFAALLLACGLERFTRERNPGESVLVLSSVFCIALLPAVVRIFPFRQNSWSWPAIPEVTWHEETNAYQTRIRVPEKNMLCWNTPVPCAPFLRSGLKSGRTSSQKPLPQRYFFIAESDTAD